MEIKKTRNLFLSILLLACLLLSSCSLKYDMRLSLLDKSLDKLELNYRDYSSDELRERIDFCDDGIWKLILKNWDYKLTDAQQLRLSALTGKYHRILIEICDYLESNDTDDNEELLMHIDYLLDYLDFTYGDEDSDFYEEEEESSTSIENVIKYANEDLPETIDEGMILTKIVLEGDYVVYIVSIDEDVYDINEINKKKNEIKKEIKSTLITDDSDIASFLKICKNYNKGIAYRYIGSDTHKTVTVYIEQSEISSL